LNYPNIGQIKSGKLSVSIPGLFKRLGTSSD